jgi:uncharacterized membrane protein (UPF0127 family)
MTMGTTTAYVIFPDGFRVEAEVATTNAARARGLMFRDSLDERAGMVFPFPVPGRYAFWMKNVRVPLDIIWLDAQHRVVWIVERAAPCLSDPCPMYLPSADASFVVEVMGGFVATHGVAVGDCVALSWRVRD